MELGIPITMLGVIAIVVGWATYSAGFDKTVGLVVFGLGVIVAIIGVVLWVMRRNASKPIPSQTTQ